MTKASDNAFPSILITEGTEPAAPAASKQRLYIDSTSHNLKIVNSSGVESNVGMNVLKVAVSTDVTIGAASYTDVFSLALGAGTWDLFAILVTNGNTTNPGTSYNTYAELVTGASTRIAQNVSWTFRYGTEIGVPYATTPVTAMDIAGSQTIKLRCYCDVATKAVGTTSLGTGGGTMLRAIRVA